MDGKGEEYETDREGIMGGMARIREEKWWIVGVYE